MKIIFCIALFCTTALTLIPDAQAGWFICKESEQFQAANPNSEFKKTQILVTYGSGTTDISLELRTFESDIKSEASYDKVENFRYRFIDKTNFAHSADGKTIVQLTPSIFNGSTGKLEIAVTVDGKSKLVSEMDCKE